MKQRKSTITDLPAEIERLIPAADERTNLINQIIIEARQGEFHDYRNKKYVCGKIELVSMLQRACDARLLPLVAQVVNGDYDEPANEDDVAMMKKDWLDNGGTLTSWDKLFKIKI